MKYTTLLFDLDDTLLDFGKAEDNAINMLLEKYNIPATEENKRLYVNINKAKWTALEKGEITRKELFTTRFDDFFTALGIEADGIKANEEYISFLGQGHFLLDGALETCRVLHEKYSMYIITNGAKKAQEGRLTDSPLMEYFNGVFISEEIGFDKPKKEYFDFVYAHIPEKDKSKTLVIGDSLNSDIAGAVNYGVDSCWVNRGEEKPSPANYTVKKVADLLLIL